MRTVAEIFVSLIIITIGQAVQGALGGFLSLIGVVGIGYSIVQAIKRRKK